MKRRGWLALLLALPLLVRSRSAEAEAPSGPLVVVVRADCPVNDLPRATLRRIFLSEPLSTGGSGRFIPFNQPLESPARVAFDRAVLGLEPNDVGRFWVDQRIRGRESAPRAVPNVVLLGRVVTQLAGSIAYLRANEVPPGAKVLTIDGKRPGEPDYPFP